MASLANSPVNIVPKLYDANTESLKARLDGLKCLGLVRVSPEEYIVIYDGKHLFVWRTRFSQLNHAENRMRLLHH